MGARRLSKVERRTEMNTQIAVHPRLHHYGLTTAKLDAMVDW
jgi:hypothetical protein